MKILFEAKTKGNRYRINAFDCEDGSFTYKEFTRNMSTAVCVRYSLEEIKMLTNKRIEDAKRYDGINYHVSQDWQ